VCGFLSRGSEYGSMKEDGDFCLFVCFIFSRCEVGWLGDELSFL